MAAGRPKQPIVLEPEARRSLEAVARSRSLPHGLVLWARLVLMAAQGETNQRIAEKLDLSHQSVWKWRQRYLRQGLAGLDRLVEYAGRGPDARAAAALPCLPAESLPRTGSIRQPAFGRSRFPAPARRVRRGLSGHRATHSTISLAAIDSQISQDSEIELGIWLDACDVVPASDPVEG